MEYLMKEEELVREMAKAKEEVESMQKDQWKYTTEVIRYIADSSMPEKSGRKK